MPTDYELMEHERMRWSYMTVEQLRTRVSRIRNPAKLRCFARMCEERDSNYLSAAAIERASQLGVSYLPISPINSGRLARDEDKRAWTCPVCGLNSARWGECEFCKREAEQKAEQVAREEAEKKKRKGVRLIRFKGKFSLDK